MIGRQAETVGNHSVIDTIPRRVAAVIHVNGGYILYILLVAEATQLII